MLHLCTASIIVTTTVVVSDYCMHDIVYRIIEGAANNLPDYQALCAARKILALCHGAGEGEVVIALISGGGSALLPCPLEGVELEDKRMASGSCVHFCADP